MLAFRDNLLLSFSSTVSQINRTYIEPGGRVSTTTALVYYRYAVPKIGKELEIQKIFENKYKRLVNAKQEMNGTINDQTFQNLDIYKGHAAKLDKVETESVDYIYTDPALRQQNCLSRLIGYVECLVR